jgi:hypothetical protein
MTLLTLRQALVKCLNLGFCTTPSSSSTQLRDNRPIDFGHEAPRITAPSPIIFHGATLQLADHKSPRELQTLPPAIEWPRNHMAWDPAPSASSPNSNMNCAVVNIAGPVRVQVHHRQSAGPQKSPVLTFFDLCLLILLTMRLSRPTSPARLQVHYRRVRVAIKSENHGFLRSLPPHHPSTSAASARVHQQLEEVGCQPRHGSNGPSIHTPSSPTQPREPTVLGFVGLCSLIFHAARRLSDLTSGECLKFTSSGWGDH